MLGHSVGEVAAAFASGVFDLPQATRVIHERSRAQAPTRGRGRMAALGLSPGRAIEMVRPYGGEVELAAVNSPSSVTLCGPLEALEELGRTCKGESAPHFRILDLDYAFHSREMDPVRDGLLAALEGLAPSSAEVPFVSTVSGEMLSGRALGARYWWDNVRRPVRFDKALATICGDGPSIFLEVGPHPIMQGYLNENLRATGSKGRALPVLRRDNDGVARVWEAIAAVHVHGGRLDFGRLFPGRTAPLALPAYPWQKESFWYRSTDEALGAQGERLDHPLLGYPVRNAPGEWRCHIDSERLPWLADHVVGGAAVFPAAAFIEMALAASRLRFRGERHIIENLEIRVPLLLEAGVTKTLRFRVEEDGAFAISSRTRLDDSGWAHHAGGKLEGAGYGDRTPRYEIDSGLSDAARALEAVEHYRATEALGLHYGPAFQGLAQIRSDGDTAWARIRPAADLPLGDLARYCLHPCVLDPCLQMLASMAAAAGRRDTLGFLPFKVGRLVFHEGGDEVRHCRAAITRAGTRSIVADFALVDARGSARVEIEEFRFRRMRLVREDDTGPARYVFRTELRTRRSGRSGEVLPRPTDIAEHLVPKITEQWFERSRSDYYDQVLPLFDALAAAFAYRALRAILGSRSRFTLPSLLAASRADAAHAPLLQRLVEMLEEDGVAERQGAQWKLNGAPELAGPEEIWRLVLADFPACLPEAVTGGRAGLHLPEVLRGERDASDVLASAKGVAVEEHLFEASPILWMSRYALGEALAAVLAEWPAGRRLRILEIGAGAMGTSAELLSMVPPERCDYVFASANRDLVSRAGAEFGGHRGFAAAEIDFGRDPSDQQARPQRLRRGDRPLVVARDARSGHGAHGDSLAAGAGRPAADDRTRPERMNELMFGLDPEWWVRSLPPPAPPRGRLLGGGRVVYAAREAGFCRCGAARGAGGERRCEQLSDRRPEPGARRGRQRHVPSRAGVLAGARRYHTRRFARRRIAALRRTTGDRRRRRDRVPALRRGYLRARSRVCRPLGTPVPHSGRRRSAHRGSGPHAGPRPRRPSRRGRCRDRQDASALGPAHRALHRRPRCASAPVAGHERRPSDRLRCASAPALSLAERARRSRPGTGERTPRASLPHHRHSLRCAFRRGAPLDGGARGPRQRGRSAGERRSPSRPASRAPASGCHRLGESPRIAKGRRALRLDFATPGPLTNLGWHEVARRAPGRGEIEIKVRATGLNFRDVMYAMGILSDEAVENGFAGATLGMECAGDVVAVGPDVTGFRIGDPVVCFAPACFATYVTTGTTAVAHRPSGWTCEESATIPSVFFTVYYALHHLGDLSRGDKLLIHGAAGGVGMAAIQYARYVGAEVFATAGSPRKRDFLRLLGIEHVLDSRSLVFADRIMEITGEKASTWC